MKNVKCIYSTYFVWVYILLFFLCANLTSCIKEDLSACPSSATLLMRVKAVDIAGADITASGDIHSAKLYVFDRNQKFVYEQNISATELQNPIALNVDNQNSDNFWIVLWANTSNKEDITNLLPQTTMQNALVQLKKDVLAYAINPDDLFLGVQNLTTADLTPKLKASPEIVYIDLIIRRQTANLFITVKGLDPQYTDYYFVVSGSQHDAYNFSGVLAGNPIEYKQTGVFDRTQTYFASNQAFSMFPLSEGNNCTIAIYRGTQLIVSSDINNQDGKKIVPVVGKTTNVLLDLYLGSLGITLQVTDWNEIYHWYEW